MFTVLASSAPIFILIAIGFALKKAKLFPNDMWDGLEKLCFVLLFPILIASTLGRADLTKVPWAGAGGAMIAGIVTMTILLLALRPFLHSKLGIAPTTFTSLYQGSTRWNTFVSLAIVEELFPSHLSIVAVGVVAMIPLLNVLNVSVMAHFASPTKLSAKQIFMMLLKNPLIWSCVVGFIWNISGLTLKGPPLKVVESLSAASLSLGLLVVGAGLSLKSLQSPNLTTVLSVPSKLLLMPLFMAAFGLALKLDPTSIKVVMICGGVQTAASSYLLAKQMGGDSQTMAAIYTVQTLFSIISIPLLIGLF